MGVGAVAGTKLFIGGSGGVPSYVEIGEISNLGNLSQQFAQITVESVGSGDTYQIKGTRSFPNFELTLNRSDTDVGQVALKAASDAARGTLYHFKIQDEDGANAIWQGEVFGYGPAYGGVNVLKTVATSISIRPSTFTFTPAT